jgi:hypothetical protein
MRALFLNRFARHRLKVTFELPANHFLGSRHMQPLHLEKAYVPLRGTVTEVPESSPGYDGREKLLDALNGIIV